ncbi:aminoacyl-tRNA hydrolase [Patescibacteria group bacterium]|nr:aminoacyl-tRNA hydrolase [Patescibacteria group bacterium]
MKLIVGLGNPGKKYEKTRHNVGFMVLDKLAENNSWKENKKAKALYLKKEINGEQIELIKPLTFMNDSGMAMAYAVKKHNLKLDEIFIVYDDSDLPLGKLRIGKFKSAGGHHGIESILQHLRKSDFLRFKVGIRPQNNKQKALTFILKSFSAKEKKLLQEMINKTVEAIKDSLTEPIEKVMNKYN